jgi:glycosyltransferase involved in cell wall biosynthesis
MPRLLGIFANWHWHAAGSEVKMSDTMRVLFDYQIFSEQKYGGISRCFAELALELNRIGGVAVQVSSPLSTNAYVRKLPPDLRNGLLLPPSISANGMLRKLNRLASTPLAWQFRPDILHRTYYRKRGTFVHPKLGLVTTVHDMIHERFPEDFHPNDVTAKIKRQAVDQADLLICVSESTRRDLIEIAGVNPAKTCVVYHGVDHLITHTSVVRPHAAKPFLLYVGLRSAYKNFGCLLKAWRSDRSLFDAYDLVCFGGGPWTDSEKALAAELGIPLERLSLYSGDDEVLVGLYRHAEVFVYPSLYEGFGIPPLEAMSLGCPVISSNVSSMPEVLGSAAEYFEPEDCNSLQSALCRVLGDAGRQNELKMLGKVQAGKYTWKRCATETLAAYNTLA